MLIVSHDRQFKSIWMSGPTWSGAGPAFGQNDLCSGTGPQARGWGEHQHLPPHESTPFPGYHRLHWLANSTLIGLSHPGCFFPLPPPSLHPPPPIAPSLVPVRAPPPHPMLTGTEVQHGHLWSGLHLQETATTAHLAQRGCL